MDEAYMELDLLERILDGSMKPRDLPLSLLKNITDNFSEKRKIGEGGFGIVYKGALQNAEVAVKRISKNVQTNDENLFRREVDSMMEVNHQNIVRFIGFCSNTEHKRIQYGVPGGYIYAEARERILCFEYINKGSLDKYITDELRGLEWNTRYNIIKGICDGLEYLHMKKHIIHLDLKPANVLLDNHMVAKITDFGLARMDGRSHTTNQVFTPGYCAPEYLLDGRMSVKSDVYSLGVIIIELVMGHKGIPDINNVLRRWRHRWGKSANGTPFRYQQIAKLVEIGSRCQEHDPYKRPFISEIVRDIKELEIMDREISNANESTISPYWEDDMLGVKPLVLCFPFVLNKQISCTLEVTNETNSYIAFNIETMSPLPYCIKANKDIVPPQSKCSVNITLQPLDKVPQGKQYSDSFIIRSTKVSEGLTSEDITEDMFNLEEGKVVDEVNLTVVHDEPFEPHVDLSIESLTISGTRNSPEKSNVPPAETESTISSSFSNGLIQFDPPELCFPLLSNVKTVLSSVKIVNITDCYVGFNTYFLERNVAVYTTSYGVVPPRSTQVITVRGKLKEDAVIDSQFNDKYFVWNGIMAEDVRHDIDLSDYMDSEESEELPIVLTEMIPGTLNDLIQFDPPELSIPCWPNKASMSSLNIENITDYYVGFITSSLIPKITSSPGGGILPPRSTQRILIKRVAKETETEIEDMTWEDKFFVWNMIVAEGVAADNLIPCFTEEALKELPINLQKISPCDSDELIRFDPPELCFPFLPNKTSLSSVNMINMTDYSIYFKNYGWKKNKAWYDTEPRNGIMPPRSTQRLVVKRETMENELEDSESKDKCFLQNFVLTQDVKADDLLLLNEEGTELPIDNLCDCVVENKDGTELPVYHSRSCHVANEEITELPIVLAKINPSTSNELIRIAHPELCFPFSPKKNLFSLIKIVNITDYYIGFNTFGKENNAALYNTEPPCGILAPQSTQELVVTRIQKGDALEETQCKDKYIVWSSFVNEGVNTVDLKGCTSEKESKELPIVFMHTNSNELIQFDPPELFLPLVPNKSLLSSVNIVNRTDHFIGFSICTKKTNSAKYFTNPSEGILPPRSTQLLMVTRIAEEKELTGMPCKDKYMVWNGIVSEDVSDVIDSMSEIKFTELPIVLTETSSPAPDELIHFDSPELCFPILPNKKVMSSIKIVNITDYNVGFNTYSRPTNAARYHTEPPRGILPPQSTQKLMVTRERKEDASEHMQVDDRYFVWNSIVSEGVKDSDLGDYMVGKESKELPIVLSKVSSLTSNELIQFDPAELHSPLSPQEIFPFKFNIVNITDFNVAFNVYSVVKNAARRKESFMEGILPPRSTEEHTMVWQLKEIEPGGKEYEYEDKIFFWSRLVTEGVEAKDIIGYMNEEESKELPIFFHKPLTSPTTLLSSTTPLTTRSFQQSSKMDRLFPPRPAMQLVLRTKARDAPGFPAILIALVTRLGYRWYPEYMVYEDYREFNQEQYHADLRIYDQQDNSETELHVFHGIGVTVEMAVHDAAYTAVARLRGENSHLDASEFRYIPYAPAGDDTGYYTAICAPYERRRYDPHVLIQCTQALDRTARALAVELFATRALLYDTLTRMLPAVRAGIQPEYILYPSRTQMPMGIDWPAVGGHRPVRGPLLSARDRVLHQSAHGEQDMSALETHRPHLQLPRFSGFPRR